MVRGGIGLKKKGSRIDLNVAHLTKLTRNHCMVSLVWLQRDLFNWFEVILPQRLDLGSKHLGRRYGGVDTVRLDGNHGMTTVFEEVMSVHSNDAGLIRLSNIRKDNVDSRKQHAVSLRQSRIFHDCYKMIIKSTVL